MESVIVVVVYVVVLLTDFLPALHTNSRKENWIYGLAAALSFFIVFSVSRHIPVPGPSGLIRRMVEAMLRK